MMSTNVKNEFFGVWNFWNLASFLRENIFLFYESSNLVKILCGRLYITADTAF